MDMRKTYPTDLTDKEWEIVKPFVAAAYQKGKSGRRPTINKRELVNAIFYVLQSGCSWRMLPHDFPEWESVYWYFKLWETSGITEKLHDFLRKRVRRASGKKEDPTVGIADSQSVKTTEKGGSAGMTAARKLRGGREIFS